MTEPLQTTQDNIRLARQAIALIESMDDELFCRKSEMFYQYSVASHFRHLIEHYNILIAGHEQGIIDYDRRERNADLERDRALACASWRRIIEELSDLTAGDLQAPARIRMDGGGPSREADWCDSNIRRELIYLAMHDVHHFAIIAGILRMEGFTLPGDFGMAPSTLRHHQRTG